MTTAQSPIRLGIIGMGGMGRGHVGRIRAANLPNLQITAACDVSPNLAADYPELKCFSNPAEFFNSGEMDAVMIVTPHYSHTDLGIQALQAGLHVLVEKPISVHKADCERLLAAHTDKNLVFAAMFNMRTLGLYRKIKSLLDEEELGPVRRIVWTVTDWFRTQSYYDSGGWRGTWKGEGGGVLLNQCPHQLDLWHWLFGMPQRVTASIGIGRHHRIEVEDDVTAILDYDNGTTGVFITSTGEAPGTNRLEISGDRGKITVEQNTIRLQRNRVSLPDHLQNSPSGFAQPECWDISVPFEQTGQQHTEIIKNFAAAIQGEAELLSPAEDGIHSVELGNAMLLSGLKQQTIDLPLDAAEFERELQALIAASEKK